MTKLEELISKTAGGVYTQKQSRDKFIDLVIEMVGPDVDRKGLSMDYADGRNEEKAIVRRKAQEL